jgi:hypothetical protein
MNPKLFYGQSGDIIQIIIIWVVTDCEREAEGVPNSNFVL